MLIAILSTIGVFLFIVQSFVGVIFIVLLFFSSFSWLQDSIDVLLLLILFSVETSACPRSNYKLLTASSSVHFRHIPIRHPNLNTHRKIVEQAQMQTNKQQTAHRTYHEMRVHTDMFSYFLHVAVVFASCSSVTSARTRKMLTMKSTKNEGTIRT